MIFFFLHFNNLFRFIALKFVQVAWTWLSLNCHLQVNWTPYFLEELLELRDTWILLTFSLGILLISLVLLLVFLRQRIFLAVALIQQGSKAVSQVGPHYLIM